MPSRLSSSSTHFYELMHRNLDSNIVEFELLTIISLIRKNWNNGCQMSKIQPEVTCVLKSHSPPEKAGKRKKKEQLSQLQSLLESHVKLRGIPLNSIHKISGSILSFL